MSTTSSPVALCRSLSRHWELITRLTQRDVIGRYRGSILGVVWSLVTPILLLVVYTFVFSVVFNARWDTGETQSRTAFAMALFVGLIVHGFFAECVNRAPALILDNANYVKKVVFPLEILPVTLLGAALFHACISIVVLLAGLLVVNGGLPVTVISLPVVILPLAIVTLGLSWLLASIGVYFRDINQAVGILTMILMFLSPIFYPLSALPEAYQKYILLNPLTFIIEEARAVLIQGDWPDWRGLGLYVLVSLPAGWMCFWWFQKTRQGFSDVI